MAKNIKKIKLTEESAPAGSWARRINPMNWGRGFRDRVHSADPAQSTNHAPDTGFIGNVADAAGTAWANMFMGRNRTGQRRGANPSAVYRQQQRDQMIASGQEDPERMARLYGPGWEQRFNPDGSTKTEPITPPTGSGFFGNAARGVAGHLDKHGSTYGKLAVGGAAAVGAAMLLRRILNRTKKIEQGSVQQTQRCSQIANPLERAECERQVIDVTIQQLEASKQACMNAGNPQQCIDMVQKKIDTFLRRRANTFDSAPTFTNRPRQNNLTQR